jgi:tetratricopeptide (TPR) repeat protein
VEHYVVACLAAIFIALACQASVVALFLQLIFNAAYHFESYTIAVRVYKMGLGWLERLTGEESYLLASSCDGLAVLLNAQEKYQEAEPLYKRSLTIYRRLVDKDGAGGSNLDIFQSMTHTAEDYSSLLEITGRDGEAKEMLLDAARMLSDYGLTDLAEKLKKRGKGQV